MRQTFELCQRSIRFQSLQNDLFLTIIFFVAILCKYKKFVKMRKKIEALQNKKKNKRKSNFVKELFFLIVSQIDFKPLRPGLLYPFFFQLTIAIIKFQKRHTHQIL